MSASDNLTTNTSTAEEVKKQFTEEQLQVEVPCKTKDGDTILVIHGLLLQSGKYSTMIENMHLDVSGAKLDEFEFHVKSIPTDVFHRIVDWLEEHDGKPDLVPEEDPDTMDCKWIDFSQFQEEFFQKLDVGELSDVLTAAHFLQIKSLYFCACQVFAKIPITYTKDGPDFEPPLPAIKKFFSNITINHFDAKTPAFLDHFELANVKLHLRFAPSNLGNLRTILTNLMPMLNGTYSISCSLLNLPTVIELIGEKLAKLKVLTLFYQKWVVREEQASQQQVNAIIKWLNAPQQANDGPRLCEAHLTPDNPNFARKLYIAIREDFKAAKTPRTFAVVLDEQFGDFNGANSIGEELHCKQLKRFRLFLITRHPANCDDKEALQEWVEKSWNPLKEFKPHTILFEHPTVGQIDAANEGEVDQRPSTSKEA